MQRALTLIAAFALLALTQTTIAQRNELIVGEWIYSEPLNKEKLDATAQQMLDVMFSSVWFSIKADGTYAGAWLNGEEAGTWKMDAKGERITFTSGKGVVSEFDIIELTASAWHMAWEPGKGFKLVHGARKLE